MNTMSQEYTAPIIDNSQLGKPILLKCDEPAAVTVRVSGNPVPLVRWNVAKRWVKDSSRYQMQNNSDGRYTLTIARVTDEVDKGIWVVATNELGEDSCLLDVKAYKVLSGHTYDSNLIRQTYKSAETLNQAPILRKKLTPRRSSETRSVILYDAWTDNMSSRDRTRSVGDTDLLDNSTSLSYHNGHSEHTPTPELYTGPIRSRRNSTDEKHQRQISRSNQRQKCVSTDAVFNDDTRVTIPQPTFTKDSELASRNSVQTPTHTDCRKDVEQSNSVLPSIECLATKRGKPPPGKKKKVPTATLL